jgi:uncharacterized repeat protein (TIGR03803 family)
MLSAIIALGLIAGLGLIPAGQVTAQTFTTLHNFSFSEGSIPFSQLSLSGKTLYGTTYVGGASRNGTVFAVNTDGTGFTNLHSFTANNQSTNGDGVAPSAGLVLAGNTLYGTASGGGTSGNGNVFAVDIYGTGFTNLYSFTALNNAANSDGADPSAGLILSGNVLYGTARYGGSSGNGTVFAVHGDGTGFTNLHNFSGGIEGANPIGGLVLKSNTLYGTAAEAGESGNGTVFKVKTDGTGFATLHSFNGDDGANPLAGLVFSGNTLYGTARNGGSSGKGTIFTIKDDGTDFTNLHSFTALSNSTNNDGANPHSGLILAGDTVYGTARFGGSSGSGTIFGINTNGTSFTNLHSLTGSDGANPFAGLILSGSTLYGTASQGGSSGNGTVFSLSLQSGQADSLVLDGDFNSLAVGTAPDIGVPAGHWSFPPDYAVEGVAETNVSEFSIAVAPGGTNGNSLHLSADATILGNQHLPNIFTQSVNKGAGVFLIATFDLYVAAGHGGGSVHLGNGSSQATSRGPQIAWDAAGDMIYTGPDASRGVIGSYLQGIWQSVRIEVDIDNDRYNFYAGQRGFPFSVITPNLPYRSGALPFVDRFTIARFDLRPDVDSYFDNIVVELAPVSAPQLSIIPSGANVVLKWPTNAAGFTLQSATNLVSPATWTTNAPAPVVVNGLNAVTNPISSLQKFYRLSQ